MDASLLLGNWYTLTEASRVRFTATGTMHWRFYPRGIIRLHERYTLEGQTLTIRTIRSSFHGKNRREKKTHSEGPGYSYWLITEVTTDHLVLEDAGWVLDNGKEEKSGPWKLFRSREEAMNALAK